MLKYEIDRALATKGMEFSLGDKTFTAESVVGCAAPKNGMTPRMYCMVKSGGRYFRLEYREADRGCGNYKWFPAYPCEIGKEHVKTFLKDDAWGGWDNGHGEPMIFDKDFA